MNENIKDIITELDRITDLYNQRVSLSYDIHRKDHTLNYGLLEIKDNYYPKLPSPPKTYEKIIPPVENTAKSKHKLTHDIVGIAFLAICGITLLNSLSGEVPMYGALIPVLGIVYLMIRSKYSMDLDAHKNQVKKREEFLAALSDAYLEEKLVFDALLDDYYTDIQLYEHKKEEFRLALDEEIERKTQKLSVIDAQLAEVTLINEKHFSYAENMSEYLQSGRADSLKEALNLAIAEENERQFHAQQQMEQERQTKILEQQAYEERMHNQQLQREAAAQSQIAQAQLKATQEQNKKLDEILKDRNRR